MTFKLLCISLLTLIVSIHAEYIKFHPRQKSPNTDPPKWPTKYYAQGTLNLPYAEISEPFSAWYDGNKNSSRIDFYGGSYFNSYLKFYFSMHCKNM